MFQQEDEDGRMSRKILDLARDQQEEIARELDEDEEEVDEEDHGGPYVKVSRVRTRTLKKFNRSTRHRPVETLSEDEDLAQEDEVDEEDAELVSLRCHLTTTARSC